MENPRPTGAERPAAESTATAAAHEAAVPNGAPPESMAEAAPPEPIAAEALPEGALDAAAAEDEAAPAKPTSITRGPMLIVLLIMGIAAAVLLLSLNQ